MIDRIRTESLTIKLESNLKDKIKKLALYHDLGHLPFSHTFEYAFEVLKCINPSIYNQILNSTGLQVKLFKLHEMIGIMLLEEIGDQKMT